MFTPSERRPVDRLARGAGARGAGAADRCVDGRGAGATERCVDGRTALARGAVLRLTLIRFALLRCTLTRLLPAVERFVTFRAGRRTEAAGSLRTDEFR